MLYSLIFIILAGISYRYWRYKFIPAEAGQNAADIKANGAADNLQRGYHGRETWSRIWPGLVCCLAPAVAPALLLAALHWLASHLPPALVPMLNRFGAVSWLAVCLAFLATAALLAGAFARDFTPRLNLARAANGDTWVSEWYASPASKSWPDAGSWKIARKAPAEMLAADRQDYANHLLKGTITSTWLWCRLTAGALAVAAVVAAAKS